MNSAVVITDAPRINYMHNFVILPYYYGTEKYFNRPDVKAIRETVQKNLDDLDRHTGWKDTFRGRKVLIKPNLVAVMHKSGNRLDDVPQSTDPRVFEAIVSVLSDLDCKITIVEGTGKGISTTQLFHDVGLDKVAKRYKCDLVAVEEQPIDHYYVPKAEVQKDVYIPRIFSEVVRGEALYVSVPKMKTNLYTGVTLGFKNAMGTLSGNMRYRNHSWQIEKKLVDLLYLFKPNLTVIDGIIGGEGGTPAPVDPVKVGMIVSGTNSVEVDRVTTRIMGIDPNELALTKEAEKRGFGDPTTEIFGTERVVPFRRAESSFLTPRFRKNWPGVRLFVGYTNSRTPVIADINNVTPEMVYQLEGSCRGGCMATMSMYMEMLVQGKKQFDRSPIRFAAIIGDGCEVGGKRYWFDPDGKPFDLEALEELKKEYKNVIGCGACMKTAAEACTARAKGCGNVGEFVPLMQKASGKMVPLLSPDNDSIGSLVAGMVKKYFVVRKVLKSGEMVEIPFDAWDDHIFPIPELSDADKAKDWIFVPMEKQTPEQIRENLKAYKMIQAG
jgi:uncharacterized protein (DUF362 family)